MLELWHGPTCAFKDMALQILPYFLTTAVKKLHMDKKVVILVATSGDTGKAALEGFKDVLGTEIMVFYPVEGVSDMQKRQMVTQEGENVTVCAVRQLRRLPEWCQEDLHRPQGAGSTGTGRHDILQCELH